MSKSQKDMGIQNGQNTAELNQSKENSSEELFEREQLEGTPFQAIGNKEKGYFLALGKWRITEIKKTRFELIDHLEKDKWRIIFNMIATMIAVDKELPIENNTLKK